MGSDRQDRTHSQHRSRSQRRDKRRSRNLSDEPQRRPVPTPNRGHSARDAPPERNSRDERRTRAVLTARDSSRQCKDASRGDTNHSADATNNHRRGSWQVSQGPLPRPGFDEDRRLDELEDDPRYFAGAELGKAQKAAMGVTGLLGRNTASFDPASTLVRPLMRCFYGEPTKRYGKPITPDDAIIVPDFLGKEDDRRVYDGLSEELRQMRADGGEDLTKLPMFQVVLSKICKYARITQDDCAARLSWDRKGSEKKMLEYETAPLERTKDRNCTCVVSLGSSRELAFWNKGKEDSISFSQRNGVLLLFSRDVVPSWHRGVSAYRPEDSQQSKGFISITVVGRSSELVECDALLPKPVKQAANQGPCRDFKLGRCNYGDRCRFSHGETNDKEESTLAPFDPTSLVARPSIRIMVEPNVNLYPRKVKHDDAIIVPGFYGEEESWDIYYQLIKEMRAAQSHGDRKSEWIPWHEGAHLLSQNPTGSPLFHKVQEKMRRYFGIPEKDSGTRFNWYRDGSDWKPFHHDSAAFNAQRARTQNCTVGISFGTSRELAFRHAKTEELIYVPQPSGTLFFFGQDVNILWQHGLNALPEKEQGGKGRISLILWGLCTMTVDEAGSPGMLLDGAGKGKGKDKGKGKGKTGGKGGPCRDYARGKCSYGDRCSFSHD